MVMMTEPLLRWLLCGLLVLVWGAMLMKLQKQHAMSVTQRRVKAVLNTLLFAVAVLFLVQPSGFQLRKKETLLIHDSGVPRRIIDSVKAAGHIQQAISYKTFRSGFRKYPDHRFVFLGSEAEPGLLSHLAGKEVKWVPYFPAGALEDISWEGMLRKGERQAVSGKISLSRPAVLKLVYGEKTLDSLSLKEGFNAFQLSFRVFSEGRTAVSLELDDRLLREIAFFARPVRPLSVTIFPDNPDFETRILAEWLGEWGHHVAVFTPVAQSVLYETRVNTLPGKAAPDLVIATPSRAAEPQVRKAVAENRSVLFYALQEVPDALLRINRATGSAFSARRTSDQETRPLKNGLSALPYELNYRPNQRQVSRLWPVSFQKNGARVAVSLLQETFPARLSGDTLTYNEIWGDILAGLDGSDSVKVRVPAPVFSHEPARISLQTDKRFLTIEKDTLYLAAVHPQKKHGEYLFAHAGWKSIDAVGEIYVEDPAAVSRSAWQSRMTAGSTILKEKPLSDHPPVPATLWFMALLLCLAALWVEAKFRY